MMPNWTQNTLRAEGPEAAVRASIDAIKGLSDPIDFDRIIPMPPLLRHTSSGRCQFAGKDYTTWFVENPDADLEERKERPFTDAEQAALKDIGYTDWYSWSIRNWGTKWNACHQEILEHRPADGFVEFRFETAWSMPQPIAEKLFEMFPALEISWTWSDEHDGYTMRYSMERDPIESGDDEAA